MSLVLFADYTKGTSLNWKDTAGAHVDTAIVYKHGVGAEFNGSSSYIDYGNPDILNFGTGDFAIEFISRSRTRDHTSDWAIVFSKYDTSTQYQYCYYRNVDTLQLVFYGSAALSIVLDDATQFNHLIVQRRSGTIEAYLNGVYYGTVFGINTTDFTDNANFWIGRRQVGDLYLTGGIKFFRAYKGKALSALEVRANYQHCIDLGYINA